MCYIYMLLIIRKLSGFYSQRRPQDWKLTQNKLCLLKNQQITVPPLPLAQVKVIFFSNYNSIIKHVNRVQFIFNVHLFILIFVEFTSFVHLGQYYSQSPGKPCDCGDRCDPQSINLFPSDSRGRHLLLPLVNSFIYISPHGTMATSSLTFSLRKFIRIWAVKRSPNSLHPSHPLYYPFFVNTHFGFVYVKNSNVFMPILHLGNRYFLWSIIVEFFNYSQLVHWFGAFGR